MSDKDYAGEYVFTPTHQWEVTTPPEVYGHEEEEWKP